MLSAFLLSGCLSNTPPSPEPLDKPSESSAAYQLLKEIAPLIGKTAQDIKATTFQRNTKNREKLSISGFEIKNTEVKAGSEKDPSIEIDKFFKSRTPWMENLADGPAESQLGYQRGKLYCLVHSIANASLDEVMSYEETEYPKDFSSTFTITCGEKEEKADSPTTDNEQEIIFGAYWIKGFGVEPFWGFSLYEQTLSFSTPEWEREFPVTVYAVWWDFTIQGEEISGELSATTCRDQSKGDDHYFIANLQIDGVDYEWCADFEEFYALGDDFFKLGNIWPLSELVEKFTYESNLTNAELNEKNYRVGEISQSYVLLEMNYPDRDSVLVINHEGNDLWSVVREWREIDYDSCQEMIYNHADALELRVFQDCLDPNLAAG